MLKNLWRHNLKYSRRVMNLSENQILTLRKKISKIDLTNTYIFTIKSMKPTFYNKSIKGKIHSQTRATIKVSLHECTIDSTKTSKVYHGRRMETTYKIIRGPPKALNRIDFVKKSEMERTQHTYLTPNQQISSKSFWTNFVSEQLTKNKHNKSTHTILWQCKTKHPNTEKYIKVSRTHRFIILCASASRCDLFRCGIAVSAAQPILIIHFNYRQHVYLCERHKPYNKNNNNVFEQFLWVRYFMTAALHNV